MWAFDKYSVVTLADAPPEVLAKVRVHPHRFGLTRARLKVLCSY